MATILAHHHGALPLAVHVTTPQKSDDKEVRDEVPSPFSIVENEVNSLGYRMDTETVLSDDVASGIFWFPGRGGCAGM
jgi:hypothetical protein